MELENIAEQVCNVIGVTLKKEISIEQLKGNGLGTLDVNSMTFLMLVTNVEDEFDIEFDDDEINYEMFGDFDSFCELIKNKME